MPNFVTTFDVLGLKDEEDPTSFSLGSLASTAAASAISYIVTAGNHYADSNGDQVTYYSLSSANQIVNHNDSTTTFLLLRAWGRDKTIMPDIGVATVPSGFDGAYKSSDSKCIYLAKPLSNTTTASIVASLEDASVTFTAAAYVGVASATGSGQIQFK